MAAIRISALTSFFSGEPKSINRGENHYKSGHIESFHYSNGIIRGSVHASIEEQVEINWPCSNNEDWDPANNNHFLLVASIYHFFLNLRYD